MRSIEAPSGRPVPFTFRAPGWLAGPHRQSILSSQYPRRYYVQRRAAQLLRNSVATIEDCGDGVRLSGWYAAGRADLPLALIVHGWEGSASSSYVLSMACELYAAGHGVYRLNLRDHGASFALNPGVFHSCRLAEVIGAARAIRARLRPSTLAMVGFSLGGNFALRVAADAPRDTLDRAIAICPVLDPARTLAVLDRGGIYQRYFLRKWRRSLRDKAGAWPAHYADLRQHELGSNLRTMTEALVRAYTDFPTLTDYLNGYTLTGDRLSSLDVPSSILAALDDPIIPADDLARLAPSAALSVQLAAAGGHCGFLASLAGPSAADVWVRSELGLAAGPSGAREAGRVRVTM